MLKFKWFWVTFFGWCLIGAATAWALIYSPFHLESKTISEFTAEINGSTARSKILVGSASLSISRNTIDREWAAEGWHDLSKGVNLAAILLKIPRQYLTPIDSLAQVQMFEKGDSYRLLGLWNDCNNNQTYQWITEVHKAALKSPKPSDVNFPLKPPAGAFDILVIKQSGAEVCSWSIGSFKDPQTQFSSLYAAEGFRGRLWSNRSGEGVYILSRGSVKLMAIVQERSENNFITLVKLSKN